MYALSDNRRGRCAAFLLCCVLGSATAVAEGTLPPMTWATDYSFERDRTNNQGGSAVPPGRDIEGLWRDTYYVLGYQVAMIGILYALPESISNWSEEQKDNFSMGEWWRNVRNPQWDDDKFWINYLAHPYWGAAYYVRARERGFDERASFWYSVAMSTAFEFGAEALFEQPSIQDLVVTPVGGVILGEYFMGLRGRVAGRDESGMPMPFADRALWVLTDPLGAINRQIQTWLGVEAHATIQPYFGNQRLGERRPYAETGITIDPVFGLRVNYRW